MKIIADVTIDLPFKLDFCAKGPDIEPITCRYDTYDVTVHFPPSLSETTDGQGKFDEWSWWTGRRLRLNLACDVDESIDAALLRETVVSTADEILRRLLNSYRTRFARPDIYPAAVDPRSVEIYEILGDGSLQSLGEPIESFFYQSLPSEPPLAKSINETTRALVEDDVQSGREPSISQQLELDAEALESQGEYLRADLIRALARQQVS